MESLVRVKRNSWNLSVIVTVYTETYSVIETVERVIRNDSGSLREIILVVSPKASDETQRVARELAESNPLVKMHIQQVVPGVGWALREGMSLAKEECVAIMSGDLETEPEAVERMFQKMKETGADVVVGNRWAKDGGFENYDRFKLVLNWLFQKIFKIIYRTSIDDLTYGFKILRKHVIDSIPWESEFHEIYIETTVKPLKWGYRLDQVPTVWIGRREGKSVNTFLRNFGYVKLALKVQAQPKPSPGVEKLPV
jgi:glycosyltransferase involved in cell wall biosynthesis